MASRASSSSRAFDDSDDPGRRRRKLSRTYADRNRKRPQSSDPTGFSDDDDPSPTSTPPNEKSSAHSAAAQIVALTSQASPASKLNIFVDMFGKLSPRSRRMGALVFSGVTVESNPEGSPGPVDHPTSVEEEEITEGEVTEDDGTPPDVQMHDAQDQNDKDDDENLSAEERDALEQSALEAYTAQDLGATHLQRRMQSIMGRLDIGSHAHERCMLTLEDRPRAAMKWTHILSSSQLSTGHIHTSDSLIERLSFVWGYDLGSGKLWNPDIPVNIVRLHSQWHDAFAEGKWMLLPDTDVLREICCKLLDHRRTEAFKRSPYFEPYEMAFPARSRKFRFIALEADPRIPASIGPDFRVSRRTTPSLGGEYEHFHPPFTDLVVESHIHPYLAICSAMLQLVSRCSLVPVRQQTLLALARTVWRLWMAVPLPSKPTRARPMPSPSGPSGSTIPSRTPPIPSPSTAVSSRKRKAINDGNDSPSKRLDATSK